MVRRPTLQEYERQNEVTRTLLPFVAALPFVDDEVLARIFGLTMAIDNWLPIMPDIPELVACRPQRVARTREEQRTYWRLAQRKRRKRLRERDV